MERCPTSCTALHLIPSLSLSSGSDKRLAHSWLDGPYTIIRRSLTILGTEQESVDVALS